MAAGSKCRSAVAPLLKLRVRIPLGTWTFVCFECCVLSGSSLCDELITRPEESYRLGCVIVCDLETSRMRRLWPELGRSASGNKRNSGLSVSLCDINPLKPELNPIYYLLALLAHHFLHVSRIRVKSLTFRRLMS